MKNRCFYASTLLLTLFLLSAVRPLLAVKTETRIVRVSIHSFPPTLYLDEKGQPQGLFVELLNEIAERENWQLSYKLDEWTVGLQRLKSGDIDLKLGIAHSRERDLIYDFSGEAFYIEWGDVFVRDSAIQNILDLDRRRVAIVKKGHFATKFKQLCQEFGVSPNFVHATSPEDLFFMVENNQADAGVTPHLFALLNAHKFNLKKSPIIFAPSGVFVAVPEGRNSDLLKTIDAYLGQWKRDQGSVYYKALAKWLHLEGPRHVVPQALIVALSISIGLVALFIVWTRLLQSQIKRHTVDLVHKNARLKSEIAERKKTEERITRTVQEWETTFNATKDSIWILDQDQRIRRCNRQATGMFRISQNEIIGENCWDVVHKTEHPPANCPVLRAKASLRRETLELPLNDRWYQMTVDPILDSAGNYIGAVQTTSDITARKQTEQALHDSEERLVFHTEHSPMAVVEWDSQFIVTRWTGEAEQMFGWSAEETIGKPVFELNLVYEGDIPIVKKSIRQLADGKSIHVVFSSRNYTKDRRIIHCTWYNSVLLDQQRKMTSVMSQILDFTEQELADQRLKASLREKETLLEEIHHRVKNNMQIVASLLDLQSNSIDDQHARDILRESQSRIYAMSAIHETLYSSDNVSEIDLGSYLSTVSKSLVQTYAIDQDNITLSVQLETIKIDLDKANPLGLAINELIANALKHAFPDQGKGEISIKATLLDNQTLEVIVQDNGIGVSKEFDWETTNTLGLRLVRNLVTKQLNGSITLENGNGTTFIIAIKT